MSRLVSATAYAATHGVSRQLVHRWLQRGDVPGARAVRDPLGRTVWLIPADAPRPAARAPGRKRAKSAGK